MSARGFRISSPTETHLDDLLTTFSREAFARAEAGILDQIAEDAAVIIDHRDVFRAPSSFEDEGTGKTPLALAANTFQARYPPTRERFACRDLFYDPECSVVSVHRQDVDPDHVYFLVFAEWERHHDLFASLPGVEAFPYGDEAEPGHPSRDVWRHLIPSGIPKNHGTVFDVLGPDLPASVQDPMQVAAHTPTFDRRLKTQTENAASTHFLKRWREKHGTMPDFPDIMRYWRSEAYETDYAATEPGVRERMRPEITTADLTRPLAPAPDATADAPGHS